MEQTKGSSRAGDLVSEAWEDKWAGYRRFLRDVQEGWIGRGLWTGRRSDGVADGRLETHQAELTMIPRSPYVVKSRTAVSQSIREIFLGGHKIMDSHSVRRNRKSKAVMIGNVD